VGKDVRWLSSDEQRAWRAWLDAHAGLSARLNRELQTSSGLSLSDYDVLVHLTDVPEGRLRAFELGEGLQWEKSRVSRQVARMAARGLVARHASPEDGRGAYVTITAAGRRAIEGAAPAHVELVRHLLFDGLTAAQVRTLSTIALSVVGRLDDQT
jgi:DNA-binding MarR family transcriptional regulator